MLTKTHLLKERKASVIDRDILLFGPKRASFIKHDISKNIIFAKNPDDVLKELEEKNPEEWVVFRTRAIDAGGSDITGEEYYGPNDNGDYFSEEELLKEDENGNRAFESFVGCPLFTNHQNDDVEKARGKVVNAFYDMENHCVYLDGMIDAKAYPELARGVREGYIKDTSMGTSVKYSTCSICGNKAASEKNFCSHIKEKKGQKINGKTVYEKNYGLKFIENSFVTDGACENCTIQNVYTGIELINKVKDFVAAGQNKIEGMKKVATLKKTSGGDDIESLNNALDLLKNVADNILHARNIDFDFLEDLGSLLSELQNLIVDLVEAGFANQEEGSEEDSEEALPTGESIGAPVETQAPALAPPPMSSPTQTPPPGIEVPMRSPGTILGADCKKNRMVKGLNGLISELKILVSSIKNEKTKTGAKEMPTRMEKTKKSASRKLTETFAEALNRESIDPIVINDYPYKVIMDMNDKSIEKISGFVGDQKVASLTLNDIEKETWEQVKNNPQVVAGRLIQTISNNYNENGEKKMADKDNKSIKEALITNAPPVEQIMEGQLANFNGNFDRKNDPVLAKGQVGVTTEKQLENVPQSPETGKGGFGRVRPEGKTENLEIQEGQLDEGRPTNFGVDRKAGEDDRPITENQLKTKDYDFKRQENGSKDGGMPTTEKQFEGKDRQDKDVEEVSEGQLKARRQGNSSENTPERTIASVLNGLSNLVVSHKLSPRTLALAKVSGKTIKADNKKEIIKKAQYTQEEVNNAAAVAIANELEEDLSEDFINDTIEVLFSDKDTLASEIGKMADEKIEDLRKTVSSEDTQTVEQERHSSIADAWKKKTAQLKNQVINFSVSAAEVAEAFKTPNVDSLNPEAVMDFMMQKSKGSSISGFKNEGGSFSAIITVPEQTMESSMDQPMMEDQSAMEDQLEGVEEDMVTLSADVVKKLQKLSAEKKNIKKAQNPNGTTLPPAGGVPPAQGPMVPPVEDLGSDMPFDSFEEEEEEGFEDEGGESKPVGSFCPRCKSEDVDAMNGKYQCNNCELEYEVNVNLNILNPEGDLNIPEDENIDGEEDINEQIESSEAALPPAIPQQEEQAGMGGGLPGMAHSNAWIKEAAFQLEMKVPADTFIKKEGSTIKPIGSYCPQCAGTKIAMQNSVGMCPECGCKTHITAKHNKDNVDVKMTFQPNLTLSEKEKVYPNGTKGGYAITAECEDCDGMKEILHHILSNRKNLLKVAAEVGEENPMMACMSDQIGNGYSDETSMEICASVKDFVLKKQGLLFEDDDEEEVEDEVEFENEKDEVEDNVEFENEDKEEDVVEFEKEDNEEDLEGIEELDEEGDFKPVMDITPENITSVVIKGTDNEGAEFEVEIGSSEETEEDELEDVSIPVEPTEECLDDAECNCPLGECNCADGECLEEEEEAFSLSDLFSDGLPNIDEEEEEEEEIESDNEKIKLLSSTTSEYLRGSAVSNSNKIGGENLDIESLAAALGLKKKATMPLDTGADVPRDKTKGIIKEESVEVHTTEHKNTAKKNFTGNAAGSTLQDDDAIKGTTRGVEVIKAKLDSLKPKTAITKSDLVNRLIEEVGGEKLIQILTEEGVLDEEEIEVNDDEEPITDIEQDLEIQEEDDLSAADEFSFIGSQPGDIGEEVELPDESEAPWRENLEDTEEAPWRNIAKVNVKIKKAQVNPEQTEPVDAISEEKEEDNSEDDLEIPRSEEKAKPEIDVERDDVKNPTEIREPNYEKGPGATNLHNDSVIPRDGSGDGIGGKKPKFDKEESDTATSGNPDTYVQEFQENEDPTPVSDKDNHLGASINEAIKKVATKTKTDEKDLEAISEGGFIFVSNVKDGKIYRIALKKKEEKVCKSCGEVKCKCDKKCNSTQMAEKKSPKKKVSRK